MLIRPAGHDPLPLALGSSSLQDWWPALFLVLPLALAWWVWKLRRQLRALQLERSPVRLPDLALNDALRAIEVRFFRIFQGAPDGIVIGDFGDEGVIDVNERFEEMSGYRRDEIVGRTLIDAGLLMDRFFWFRLLAQLRTHGVVRHLEYQMRRKSGAIATVSWSAKVIELDNRPCFVSIHRELPPEPRGYDLTPRGDSPGSSGW